MSCIYMLILAGVALNFTCLAAYFCLHLLLYFAGTLFFWVGVACPYVIPYSYLHCTNARSKMRNWLSALHPFYLRTGHVSSHKLFTQSTYVIASYLLPSPQHLVLLQVDLSHLPIWDWLVQYENLCIFITHYHQAAALALILWKALPSIFRF